MNFGLQASPLKTSIMSLASSIAATAKEVNAEKETQRTEERAGKPARGEARVAEHRRDGAREAAGRMQRHDVARFAERLAGAMKLSGLSPSRTWRAWCSRRMREMRS